MATGTGTGTPASGASTTTLSTLRARIRTQMESAWGFPDPLAVDTSSETLTTLRDRVELQLQDSANATWTTASIDEAIEKALEEYNRHSPALALTDITLGADGREVDISGVSDLIRVIKVWTPYDSSAPTWPPNWVQFDVYPGQILFIDETTAPTSGDKVRIWYTTPATLNGLNSASSTTIPEEDITYIINGAAYYAAQQHAIFQLHAPTELQVPDALTASSETLTTLRARVELQLQDSANATWTTASIDEAIEKAVEEYNNVSPQLLIHDHTVSTAGREQTLVITGLREIKAVWFPYTSGTLEYPPKFVGWKIYPSKVLYVDAPTAPAVSDHIRVWHTKDHTLDGLNAAAATTIPVEHVTFLINGAAYYAAQQQALSQLQTRTELQLPDALTASSETLATLRDRVETLLQDSTNATWATADIDEAIEKAVEEYNNVSPQLLIHDHTVSTAGREQTLVITGLRDIKAVWFPYTAATLEYPPKFVGWKIYPSKVLYVDAPTAPAVSDHIRVWHTKDHTLDGLNAAAATTIPVEHVTFLINGAAAYCAQERNIEISEDVTVDDDTLVHIKTWGDEQSKTFTATLAGLVPDPNQPNPDVANRLLTWAADQYKIFTTTLAGLVPATRKPEPEVAKRLTDWADNQGKAFRYGIRKQAPSWQRHAYAYQNDDIDEAIRWALGSFNEIAPQETLTSITLSSAGREISLATITDFIRITQVWWPYTAASPESPPNWVSYETWGTPGATPLLFIDNPTEPAAGDVVRIWYLRLSVLSGLDGASTTTLPLDADTLLVTGATGYLSKERIMEEPTSRWRVPRALREWAESQLKDFAKSLRAYSLRQAAGAAGLGHLPPMDKWESQDDDKW